MTLALTRALVVFDIETTGLDPEKDRIIQLAAIRLEPDGMSREKVWLLNPGRVKIKPRATAVHGITEEKLAGAPSFAEASNEISRFFSEADLATFNGRNFDELFFAAEMRRARLLPPEALSVDVKWLFTVKEPRSLTAAVKFYLGREHEGAHDALADARATRDVLMAQLERYPDLPRDVAGLDEFGRPPDAVDKRGKLRWEGDAPVFAFGKWQGTSLQEVAQLSPSYLNWILDQGEWPSDFREIVRKAKKGEFPRREVVA
jgi:DNA polymerase-3 subunit epsilon